MTDQDVLRHIDQLVAEEHQLRAKASTLDEAGHARLRELEVQLDQLWDLLRQRRARSEFGEDPDGAAQRDATTVENYRA